MADDASSALGAPQIAGTLVNPKGLTRKMTMRVTGGEIGGVAGAIAAGLAVGDAHAGAPAVPDFGRVGYLAVSASDLALVRTRTGAMRMKVTDEVLGRVPRSEITAAELDEGFMLSHLTITFTNGVTWEFDIPKAAKKTAKAVTGALAPGAA